MLNVFTIILGAVLAAAPQFLPFIPAPYNAMLTAAIAGATGLYHLYQEI